MASSQQRQKEAEAIALQYQKDISELRKHDNSEGLKIKLQEELKVTKSNYQRILEILKENIKRKNPTVRQLKDAMREILKTAPK